MKRYAVAWVGALLIAAVLGAAAYDLVRSYDATLKSTGRELDTQARIIAEQTARSFQAVDVQLRQLVRQYHEGTLSRMRRGELRAYLQEQAVGLVQAEGLVIVGRDGGITASSYLPADVEPTINVANQPGYLSLRKDRNLGFYIGDVISSTTDGTQMFPMGRRLETSDGRFDGIVAARGKIGYFQDFYRDLRLEKGTHVTLATATGRLLARHQPAPHALGKDLPGFNEILASYRLNPPDDAQPIRLNRSPLDGVARFGAVQAVPGYPLYVVVTRDADIALAPWRAQAFGTAGRTLALAALAALLLVLLARQVSRLYEARESLEASRERFALAVAGSDDGIWDFDFANRRVFASARARELSGLPPGPEMQPMDDWFASLPIHPEDAPRRLQLMQDHLDGKTPSYDGEFRLKRDGEYRWIHLHGLCVRDASGKPHRMAGSVSDVDSRRRAEEALRASEERFALAVAGSNDGIVDWDLLNDRMYSSKRAMEIVGIDSDQEVRTRAEWRDAIVYHPDDAPRMKKDLNDFLEGRSELRDGEYRVLVKGAYRWIRHRNMCVRDAAGRPIRVAGSLSDIDAYKRAEEALRASEEQHRAIFNSTTDALILRDGQGRIVDVNPAFLELNGLSREEALSDHMQLFAPPEKHAMIRELHRRARAGETVNYELRVERKQGELADLEIRLVPVLYRGQAHSLSLARDITAQKRAAEALRASEEQYRAIFNGATDALILRDSQARIVDVNPAFLQISGHSREEVLNGAQWIFAEREMLPLAREMHQRVIAGEPVQFEIKARRKDGAPLDIEMRAVPIRYRGQPHALGMARDVTAQKRAAAERAQLEGQLLQAKKLEAIGTLAGGIAHDFNNILSAILGYGEMAQKGAENGTPLRRHVDAVVSAGMRAKSLVARILAFSRSGIGERVLVNVQSVVVEALELVAASLPKGVRLERRLGAGDAAVMGDPTQIHQVVMNLCANAAQAMKSAGMLTVSLDVVEKGGQVAATSVLAAGRYVRLSVGDTGPGIPANVLERIFDPFFTTKGVGVGTGLGLSLVHGIATDLGGGIEVDSREGEGSTFTVYLPSDRSAAARQAVEEAVPPGGGETVLLVDDEEALVRLGEEMIATLGYEPVGFTSSAAALEAFRAAPERFSAVLSDETMPDMTGSELAREIRRIRPGIPIVLMSGFVSPALSVRAKELGIAEVLAKPLVAGDIARSLAGALHP